MPTIVPTVTAENPHIYREEIERVSDFAGRLHIDLADGDFAPTKLINPVQAWWPEGKEVDIHLMYKKPLEHLATLISLGPSLVILHVESEGDVAAMLNEFKSVGIKAGIALLELSQPGDYIKEIEAAEHVLIFGGKLGYHGGEAQLDMLDKVAAVKEINPAVEVSWDGGIDEKNTRQIIDSGVDVLNVGGYIQKAEQPQEAYAILEQIVKQ